MVFLCCRFAPYDDPKYILYITVKQPRVAVIGNQIIEEIFNPLMKRSFQEYSRPQSKEGGRTCLQGKNAGLVSH